MTDLDTRYIGDRVARAWLAFKRDAEVTGAWPLGGWERDERTGEKEGGPVKRAAEDSHGRTMAQNCTEAKEGRAVARVQNRAIGMRS